MKFYFERRLLILFVITTVTLGALIYYSASVTRRLISTAQSLGHSTRVISKAEEIRRAAVDIQTGVRGYIITFDSAYLEPYFRSSNDILIIINQLDSLSFVQPEHRISMKSLRRLVLARLEVAVENVLLRQKGFEFARSSILEGRGKLLSDSIAFVLTSIQETERKLFRTNNTITARSLVEFRLVMIGLSVATALIIVGLFVGINHQLKYRLHAEQNLRKAANDVEDLYNNAPCGYHSVDASGRIIEMNQTELKWLGYSREEVVNKMLFTEIVTEASALEFHRNFESFKSNGHVHNLEFELKCKNGDTRPVLVSASAVVDELGNYLRSRTTVFDNSERKQLQLERDNFFNYTLDLFVIVSMDGKIVRWNSSWFRDLEYQDEDLAGKSINDFLHPDDIEKTFRAIDEKLKSGDTVISFENRYRSKSGKYHWLLWNAVPDLKQGLIYGFARNITGRIEAEEKVLRLNKELEAFTYSVSHDLRAPLRSVTGYARILKEDYSQVLDGEGNRLLEIITNNGVRMGQLIDDLLNFSRVGRKEFLLNDLDMQGLAQEVIDEVRGAMPEKTVHVHMQRLLPAKGDASVLRQVWVNLISNAFKYSSKRPIIEIEIGCVLQSDEICYFVKDNGAGFDMRYSEKLFGVFQRLHKNSEFEGTGVGLAVVKRIIEHHHGHVWAEGKVDGGATFYFTLPVTT